MINKEVINGAAPKKEMKEVLLRAKNKKERKKMMDIMKELFMIKLDAISKKM